MSPAPLVVSTSVGLLGEHRITPKEYLFVRKYPGSGRGDDHGTPPLKGWEIELTGLINPSRVVIHAEDLPAMDQVEYEMILQCSGNGRKKAAIMGALKLYLDFIKYVRAAGAAIRQAPMTLMDAIMTIAKRAFFLMIVGATVALPAAIRALTRMIGIQWNAVTASIALPLTKSKLLPRSAPTHHPRWSSPQSMRAWWFPQTFLAGSLKTIGCTLA